MITFSSIRQIILTPWEKGLSKLMAGYQNFWKATEQGTVCAGPKLTQKRTDPGSLRFRYIFLYGKKIPLEVSMSPSKSILNTGLQYSNYHLLPYTSLEIAFGALYNIQCSQWERFLNDFQESH